MGRSPAVNLPAVLILRGSHVIEALSAQKGPPAGFADALHKRHRIAQLRVRIIRGETVILLKEFEGERYEFHVRETQTYEIIEDVARHNSEIGVLYVNEFNRTVIKKALRDNNLVFRPLFTAKPHVFIGKNSPLAGKREITLEDLKPYPRLSYEQGEHNSFYFSEEILSIVDADKELVVLDRATLFNLLIGMNGYTICSGVISEELNGPNIIAKPLKVDDCMEIGYILHESIKPSGLTRRYIEHLQECAVTREISLT